jgi:GT2 family glycosyltransferase
VKRLQQNVGFPMAANEVARMGASNLILFISDDVELWEGTLQRMIDDMNDKTVGIVGTKNLFPITSTSPSRPAGTVQHIGLAMNIRGEIIHPLVGWSSDNPRCNQTRDVFATTGACFLIRRELFNRAGGFDTVYGRGTYEDVTLCLQIRQLGSRIIVDTNAVTYHYVGATVEKRREGFPLQENHTIFMSKFMSSGLLVYDSWTYY